MYLKTANHNQLKYLSRGTSQQDSWKPVKQFMQSTTAETTTTVAISSFLFY